MAAALCQPLTVLMMNRLGCNAAMLSLLFFVQRCFVPESARLPGVQSFKDTNKVLALSRSGTLGVGNDDTKHRCYALSAHRSI